MQRDVVDVICRRFQQTIVPAPIGSHMVVFGAWRSEVEVAPAGDKLDRDRARLAHCRGELAKASSVSLRADETTLPVSEILISDFPDANAIRLRMAIVCTQPTHRRGDRTVAVLDPGRRLLSRSRTRIHRDVW